MLRRSMKALTASAWLFAPLSLTLGGCASYSDQVKEVDTAYRFGDYQKALDLFEKSDVKEQTRNKLLYYLEKGSILDRLAERQRSRTEWMRADKLADDLYTTSISKSAASFVYNDSATDYAGEDYEKVAIHTMLAHSFLGDGNLDEARVEAARINTKLNEINGFYQDNKNKYRDDAYARYLSGMIFESLGDMDAAIVDYRNSLKVYEGDYQKIFSVSPPHDLVRALYRLLMLRDRKDEAASLAKNYSGLDVTKTPLDGGSLVVVHELGLINEKVTTEFVLPIGGQVVRFSFPVIHKRSAAYHQTGLRIGDGMFEPGEIAQNFNTIAYENLEDRRLRLIAKSAARLLLKGQITQKATKDFGAIGWLAGNIYGAVTETADTRSWTTLPAAIYVTRVFVKPGEYDVKIENNGKVSDVQKVSIKRGQLVILRDAPSKPAPVQAST